MSLASIPSSPLPSTTLSSLVQSGLDAQLISTNDSATVAPSLTPAATSTLGNFATDLANIFKDLAQNNTASAEADLTELQQALGYSSNAASDSSPLGNLLDTLSASLSSGDTETALQDLVGFFANSGQPTGNVVNTYA